MPATTLCPKCNQAVALPDNASAQAEVRCPLCSAEYVLADALPQDAPSLILIHDANVELEPHDDLNLGSEQPAGDAADTQIDFAPAQGDAATDEEPQWQSPAADESSEFAGPPTIEPESPLQHTDDVGTEAETAVESPATAGKPATRPGRKKRRGPPAIVHIAGIIIFGFIGLVLGYFILKWMGNPAVKDIDNTIAKYIPWWSRPSQPPPAVPPVKIKDDEPAGNSPSTGEETPSPSPPPIDPGPANPPVLGDEPPAPNEPAPPVNGPKLPDAPAPPAELPFTGNLLGESVSPTSLDEAVSEANQAVGQKVEPLTPNEFMTLCDLGHAAAVVEDVASDKVVKLRGAAAALIRTAAPQPRRERIASFSYQWLFGKGRPEERTGVWLVGKVERVDKLSTPNGSLVQSVIAVHRQKETAKVTVLSVDQPKYQTGDTAAVLGTIVKQPSKKLPWYTGGEPMLVISGVAIALAER
jgi:hypothetical protein